MTFVASLNHDTQYGHAKRVTKNAFLHGETKRHHLQTSREGKVNGTLTSGWLSACAWLWFPCVWKGFSLLIIPHQHPPKDARDEIDG